MSDAATTLRRWVVEFICGHRWSSEWHGDMDAPPVRCPVCGELGIAYAEDGPHA